MDLYPKNPTITKKLLAKRPNPSTQQYKELIPSLPATSKFRQNLAYSQIPSSSPSTSPIFTSNYQTFTTTQQHMIYQNNTVIIMTENGTDHNSTDAPSESSGSEDSDGSGDRGPYKRQKLNQIIQNQQSVNDQKENNSMEDEINTESTSVDGNISEYFSPSLSGCNEKDIIMESFKLDESQPQQSPQKIQECGISLRTRKGLEEFAVKNGGVVKNSQLNLSDTVSFECSRGHVWTCSIKNAKRKWCSSCAKEDKEQIKRENVLLRQKKEQAAAELQQKLFEQARIQYNQQSQREQQYQQCQNATSPNQAQNVLAYYKKIDQEADFLAKQYTNAYMASKDYNGECQQQQILQVYKILVMPDEVLKSYLMDLKGEALKAEFRRLARLIHPDKNKHPKSGAAFQKIHKLYEQAIERVEGPVIKQ